jgi:2-oxoglutarate ferredoxin oxidoreductase subunit delta
MGVSERGDVQIAAHLCKGCCLCIAACTPGVLAQSDFLNRQGYYAVAYRGTGCTGCGVCFYVCPEPGALTVRRRMQDKPSSPKPGSGLGSSQPLPAANQEA